MSPKYQVQRPEILSSTDMKTPFHENYHRKLPCGHCDGGGWQNTTTALSPFILLHHTQVKQQPSEAQSNFTPALHQLPQHWINHTNFTRTNPYLTSNTHWILPPFSIAVPRPAFSQHLRDEVPHPFHWEARWKLLFTSYWEQKERHAWAEHSTLIIFCSRQSAPYWKKQ